ncbi:hypothetical protein [Thermostaphylospora chromogena]|uniref:Uncharacterized protein n=1 Tax=Thermostaphylospora chromogena TaxID=35622 RepID=A0A1H1DDI3_9ACTN|nr:hypothetical protein [Thermostaphylospora chromogena]SDQ74553.1 hypothetical protein SAMN04489764_1955 [Thermostaphylospora chromogena]
MHVDSPIATALVCWGNAWLTGHVGLDEAVDRVERAAGPSVIIVSPSSPRRAPDSAPGPDDSTGGTREIPLRRYLAELRVDGLRALRLALPVAGDPLGLTGPPSFNSAAIEAGQAAVAVLPHGCLGLIPEADRRGSSYVGVRWTVLPAASTVPDLPSLAEAEHALSAAMRRATETLMAVGGPEQGRPDGLSREAVETLAPGYPARAHRVAALSARLAGVLRLADDRGLTAGEIGARGDALRDLDRAVRRARVAAHHAILEPGASRA